MGQSTKGAGSDPNPNFFPSQFPFFLETTNIASPYFKSCVTMKIGLNLMHTNLISRLIHATVPVPGGGEWVVLGEKKMFTKNVYSMILGWFGDQQKSVFGSPKVEGPRGLEIGTQSQIFVFFLVTHPLSQVCFTAAHKWCSMLYKSRHGGQVCGSADTARVDEWSKTIWGAGSVHNTQFYPLSIPDGTWVFRWTFLSFTLLTFLQSQNLSTHHGSALKKVLVYYIC